MQNMYTMAQSECAPHPDEIKFDRWVARVGAALGRTLSEGEVNNAHDYFLDGCSPEDAVSEIQAA